MTKFLIPCLLLATLATAQIPGPDSTFGRFGAAWVNVHPTDDQALAVALRPDGRVVTAGRTTIDSVPQMAVFQYKTDGSLDLDFHWNGKGALAFNSLPSAAHAVAVDAEGRVVLAGYVTNSGGSEEFGIVRLLPDGSYDPAFGTGGWAITDFAGGNDQANAIAIQPDGKIVAAGFTRTGADADFALARYLPNGSLDATFGTGGRVVTKFDVLADIIRDIAIQSNGKIVACGSSAASLVFNTPSYFAVARYLPDGSLDQTFNGTGKVITDIGTDEESDIARAVTFLTTGQIVVAGYSSVALASKISVVRYRPNGLLDATFGDLGVAQTEVFTNSGNFCTDIVALPDNALLLSGMAENVDFKDVFLVKMLPTGALDPAFGQNGKVVRSLSPKDDNTYGMALRPDGRILLAGDTRKDGDFYTDATLLQFKADGSKDPAFGNDGARVEDVGTSEDVGSALLVLPDGKVLVGGAAQNDNTYNWRNWVLARFQADGKPDPDFAPSGFLTTTFSTQVDDQLESLLRLPDGKVLACGRIAKRPVVVRFNAAGSLDMTFATSGKFWLNPIAQDGLCRKVILLSSGKFLAVSTEYQNGVSQSALRRFSPIGQVDPTFGTNGTVSSTEGEWVDVAELSDGDLIVANNLFSVPPAPSFAQMLRLTSDGVEKSKSTASPGFIAYRLAEYPEGKVLMTGYDLSSFGALRFASNGTADVTFNGTGSVKFPCGSGPCGFEDVLVQKDGRILLIGTEHISNGTGASAGFVVARLRSDGSPDNSWGQNGFLKLRGKAANAAALDPDGNIFVTGSINNGERGDIVVYRLLRGTYVGTADRPDEAGSRILNVFPNPVSETLTLEYDLIDNQDVAVKIYDLNGRPLHTLLAAAPRFSGKNTERVLLPSSLPAGRYTVTVETERGSVAVMVVVR